eukprot:7858553-Pyramimonas_sp.AAC.1
MTTVGRDGNVIIDALAAADEKTANDDRHVSADTRALNDPAHARHIGHRPNISHNPAENAHVAGIAEYAERVLARNASSQSVGVVAICSSGRPRSVAASYGVKQFLKQCDSEC